MPNRDLRVSDADRERVVRALERHTVAGRLTLDEFAERVGRVLAAVTHDDLIRQQHFVICDGVVK